MIEKTTHNLVLVRNYLIKATQTSFKSGPHRHASVWVRCFWTKLAYSLSLPSFVFLCIRIFQFHLSFIQKLLTYHDICNFLTQTESDCPFLSSPAIHRYFTLSRVFLCHFSFSLRTAWDPAHWTCAVTHVVGGWCPGDWGYCWAVAPQCQHITLARISARLEVRKAQHDQSVADTSLVGVFHLVKSGILNPIVYCILSPNVTLLNKLEKLVFFYWFGGWWGVGEMNSI